MFGRPLAFAGRRPQTERRTRFTICSGVGVKTGFAWASREVAGINEDQALFVSAYAHV